MTDSTGSGEKVKKQGVPATIMAIAALLTAGGTLVKDVRGQRSQELIQESVFNYATAQTAEIRDRLARLEAHMEWVRDKAMEDLTPAIAVDPGCASDEDCGPSSFCVEGRCEGALEEAAGAVGGGAGSSDGVVSAPASVSLKKALKVEKFEDLRQFVQEEQRPWE